SYPSVQAVLCPVKILAAVCPSPSNGSISTPLKEKLCIHLSSVTEDVHLAVTLEVETQNQTLVEKDVEKPGTFECISFKVSVAVVADLSVDALILTSDNSVLVKPRKSIILIETDKAFYKPGETGEE
uniref:Uncharacterized protein n=1 Tax=Phasianus colchicus TaxID=9054 RepID=A0A669QK11_PHACC